mgnify:CR=1 FL=1
MDLESQEVKENHDKEIESLILWFLGLLVAFMFILPVLLGMIIFAILHVAKKTKFSGYLAGIGVLIIAYVVGKGEGISYLATFKEMNIPYVANAIDYFHQEPLEMNFYSYLSLLGLSMVFSWPLALFAKYFWKNQVKSKQSIADKKKKESKYLSFRKNRIKFLSKQQLKYRQSESKDTFIGYSDYKERLTLDNQELNYHMFAVGGTGTGKTTLLAAVMEGALRNDKPIIFVDGKGERKAMQEFKEFCQAYGKKVYIFSEYEDYTYNPLKHGTVTEIRDKIMNLFEWSEPYYKNFSSRYLQLIVKLIEEAGLPRDLETVYKLTSAALVEDVFKNNLETKEIRNEITEEIEEAEEEAAVSQEDDMLASLGIEEQPPASKKTKTVTRIEVKEVSFLKEGLQKLRDTLSKDFSDEETERCLTGLRNQIGELLESDLGHLFKDSDKEIDLQKITDEGNIAIFSISGSRYRDYIKKLGKMVVLDVNSLVAYRQAVGKKSILAIYDEFSAYGNAEIVDIVNKARSAGFECIISTQTLADIDSIDPTLTSRILSNCNTFASGRVNDSKDAERISNQFGTFSDNEITLQIEKKHNLRKVESEKGTVREVDRFKVHPNEVKNLQIGEVFINRKMKEEGIGHTYVRRVYVRNALDLGGINIEKKAN